MCRRELEGVAGEFVESVLLTRLSAHPEAIYEEGDRLAVGGAEGFRGRAGATRCIFIQLAQHTVAAGIVGKSARRSSDLFHVGLTPPRT